jgi:hypothetical protein
VGSDNYPFPEKPKPQPCATDAQDSVEKDARIDPLFMTEKELLIESVRNTRLTLSVVQQIAALQRGEE